MKKKVLELELKAAEIRRDFFSMILDVGGAHIGPGLSCTEILTALYYGDVMKYNPQDPKWDERDRFVLSKAHGSLPLYVILADKGFFDKEHLGTFTKQGSILGCHPDASKIPGIDVTTGSLGLGLSIASGMALAAQYSNKNHRVYTLLGDGESQEGTVWESLLYAGSNGLDNLTVIFDHNHYGCTARLEDTCDVAPLAEKMRAFNFSVREVDGHNFEELLPALREVPYVKGKPNAIVAYTNKGKGISYINRAFENGDPSWHYRVPKKGKGDEDPERDMRELEQSVKSAREKLGSYKK